MLSSWWCCLFGIVESLLTGTRVHDRRERHRANNQNETRTGWATMLSLFYWKHLPQRKLVILLLHVFLFYMSGTAFHDKTVSKCFHNIDVSGDYRDIVPPHQRSWRRSQRLSELWLKDGSLWYSTLSIKEESCVSIKVMILPPNPQEERRLCFISGDVFAL